MLSTSTTVVKRSQRGSVLLFVLLGVLTTSLLLTATLSMVATESGRNITRAAAMARITEFRSMSQILCDVIWEGVQNNGALPTSAAATTAVATPATRIGDGIWTASLANVSMPAIVLGDRNAQFGASDSATMQVSALASRVRLSNCTATGTITGKPNGSTTVTSTQGVSVMIAEIPATEFQFVVSDSPFAQSASTNIIVSGKALFNRGVSTTSPMGLQFDGATTSFGVYFGAQNTPTAAAYYSIPCGSPAGFTRGIGGMANLFLSPSASVSGLQDRQGLRRAPTNYLHLSWTDSTVDPVGMAGVPGLSRQVILGTTRIVIDLSTYYGYQNIDLDCASATQANGLVVLGSASGNSLNANPLCITTNGALVLLGTNSRPAITATNYSLAIGPNAASPGANATANVSWTGYICLGISNPVISNTGGSWGTYVFNLQGTFAFPGGSITNVAVPIAITASPSTALALTAGNVLADRLIFVEGR